MPILLVLLLTAACLPIDWPNPLDLEPRSSAGLTGLCVALPLLAAATLRTWTIVALRRWPERRSITGNRYDRVRRFLMFANLGAALLAVLVFGWAATVWKTCTITWHEETILAPFAELLVPLPYFLVLFGCWLLYYDAERALHRSGVTGVTMPYWSRGGYFLHHLRQLALLVVLPVGLFVTQQTISRLFPELSQADWFRGLTIASVPVLIILLPRFIKPLLGLKSMPAGPTRDRIEAVARRLHFHYADLLVWPTHGSVANAMIVGLVPRVRYVIFTDAILEELPAAELDAVFGHEVGHAKHGHIWYYALFLALSMTVLAAVFVRYGQRHDAIVLATAAAYIFLVFGFLSRRCERQADVFGCRAVSCSNSDCTGHDATTTYPDRAAGLCPTGIRICARALERVYAMNGHIGGDSEVRWTVGTLLRGVVGWFRAWQHATMPRRIRFLLSLLDDRGRERRFQRGTKLLRWGLVIGLATALVILGSEVGWHKILEVM